MPEQPPEVHIPEDLALVPLADLRTLKDQAVAEFDRLEAGPVNPDTVERAIKLTNDIRRLSDEISVKDAREKADAKREKEALESRMRELSNTVKPKGDGDPAAADTLQAEVVVPDDVVEKITAAAAKGVAAVFAAADPNKHGKDLAQRVSSSLAEANRHVPDPKVPETKLVVTAAVDIPGRSQGDQLDFDDLVDAVLKRSRNLPDLKGGAVMDPVAAGVHVATIHQEFAHTVDDRTPMPQMEELFNYLQHSVEPEALLAGGGFCAPSEVRYDFFNIACEDGLIDLPSFGVNRGGIRFPVSPSLADIQLAPFVSAFSNASNPWLWTETDDQATVTGTPNKPCFRVPCPTFDERRLEGYGVCLTAGNLTNDAYPEATANTLRLLMAAHAHAMNARFIATMVSLSSAATTLAGGTDNAFNSIVGGLRLAAADYRARYGMCFEDVVEAVVPYWVLDAIVSDVAWRQGDPEFLAYTRDRVRGALAASNIRAQFVGDWQVRGSGQFGNASAMTAWPTTVDALVYAAGTFLKGNGLNLDLGVVRDSTLNAENDYTAAWSEEFHLIARVGHESRRYTITFNVGGLQGVGTATAPGL